MDGLINIHRCVVQNFRRNAARSKGRDVLLVPANGAHMETHKAALWTRSHRCQCCKITASVASTGGTTSAPNVVACKPMHPSSSKAPIEIWRRCVPPFMGVTYANANASFSPFYAKLPSLRGTGSGTHVVSRTRSWDTGSGIRANMPFRDRFS